MRYNPAALSIVILVPIGLIALQTGGPKELAMGALFIFAPVICAIFVYLVFGLFSLIYNLMTKYVGGIEVAVTDISQE